MASYTTLDRLDRAVLADRYGLDDLQVNILKGGAANSSFTVHTASTDYVLTILDNHTATSANRLADLTVALHEAGFPTAEIIPTRNGKLVTDLDGKPALLKRWISGSVMDTLPDGLLSAAGAVLARLHELPTSLPQLPIRTRRLTSDHESRIAEFPDREFAGWLAERLNTVRDTHGDRHDVVTHGDLYPDNLIVRPDNSLAVIDWETASLDDPLLDLGMAIIGLATVDGIVPPPRAQRIVDGYRTVRTLSAEEIRALPIMAQHAA